MTWHNGPLAGFDLETTGVDPETARIVTASIIVHGDRPVDAGWLVNPGVDIPEAAAKVHGVTTAKAQAEGVEPAGALEEISTHLEMIFTDQIPLVIYNAPYDLTVLDRETRRYGLDPFGALLAGVTAIIDPLVLDKHLDPYRKGSRTLTAACGHYQVPLNGAHESRADVLGAMRVAWRLAQRHPRIAHMAMPDLFALQATAKTEQAASLQEYFRRRGKHETVDGSWPWKPFTCELADPCGDVECPHCYPVEDS